MSQSPFLGIYRTEDGKLIDVATNEEIIPSQIKPNMTPWYGRFYDKDGVEHDVRDFIGGSGGSGGTSDLLWRPTVSELGAISWTRSQSTTAPASQNIRGPKGDSYDPAEFAALSADVTNLQGEATAKWVLLNAVDARSLANAQDIHSNLDRIEQIEATIGTLNNTLEVRLNGQ